VRRSGFSQRRSAIMSFNSVKQAANAVMCDDM
jgi:hypothetical protein